ncbi:MAG: amino acid permease [Chloroflexota bacterium]
MTTTSKRMSVSLSRGLGLFDVTMIGVGAMIGAGIFGLTGIAAGKAGSGGLLLAFFLNGIVTSLTGLTYAELGAAIPEAGGGYIFVRRGMSRFWGFFAGWISWFSNSVACSLYSVIFGAFFVELLGMVGFHFSSEPVLFGLSGFQIAEKIVTLSVIALFTWINIRGATETGTVGNIITTFKIIVLLSLVVFGLIAMMNMPNWSINFQDPGPFPNGLSGVLLAMGLTFVAFEGYEIIAQSGEELVSPQKNVPRAIFLSIAITVAIYLLVAFVSIGALVQDSGLPNWMYLGQESEKAMIRTANAIMPYGALIMIIGGLASTTSALNATIYSSSRVSYAMGRGGDLPPLFGRVHRRNRTPYIAIFLSGVLIVFMATLLPIEDVAGGASLTFLILFLMANLSLIRLRKKEPNLHRAFRAPLVPWLPYLTVALQGLLAIMLFYLSWVAWLATVLWMSLGVMVFFRLGAREEAEKAADTILLEETIAKRRYSLLLPVASTPEARQLARLAAPLALQNEGEIFTLHVIKVPQQLGLSDGRDFLKYKRPLLEEVISIGKEYDVPVRTQLRLGRDIPQSIMSAAQERDADLILLGWPGHTESSGSAFGTIIDVISANPPCDLAVVRFVRGGPPKRILVPVVKNENTQLALWIALSQADFVNMKGDGGAQVVAVHFVPADTDEGTISTIWQELREELALLNVPIDLRVVRGMDDDLVENILMYSEDFDEIVIGAADEGLLEQTLFGSIPQRVAEHAVVNVIMVKRYSPLKHGILGRWFSRKNRSRRKGS